MRYHEAQGSIWNNIQRQWKFRHVLAITSNRPVKSSDSKNEQLGKSSTDSSSFSPSSVSYKITSN